MKTFLGWLNESVKQEYKGILNIINEAISLSSIINDTIGNINIINCKSEIYRISRFYHMSFGQNTVNFNTLYNYVNNTTVVDDVEYYINNYFHGSNEITKRLLDQVKKLRFLIEKLRLKLEDLRVKHPILFQ